MLNRFPFPFYLPSPSKNLPLTLISLEDWSLIEVTGKDALQYLQGQLTCDIVSLSKNQYSFAAHCNDKGKVYSTMCVFYHKDVLTLISRRSVQNKQLEVLKKHAIFSKISVASNDQDILLGITGYQAREFLYNIFNVLPPNIIRPVLHHYSFTCLCFNLPIERFLLITNFIVFNMLLNKIKKPIKFNNSQQWLTLDIEAGYPIIDNKNSLIFIPQATNIQEIQGINFNKGCYIGQEVVARAKYQGINKRSMYWLSGKIGCLIPKISDNIELKINNNWRLTGTILAICQVDTGHLWIQAILEKNLPKNSQLRIQYDNISIFTICPLPYFLKE